MRIFTFKCRATFLPPGRPGRHVDDLSSTP
uniref:Uncharacterized protein n=1 Tax=Siphoviridae sp. ctDmR33 TaxID=2825389 RepID=A0A8S5UX48_9CAUD|nr:MAG TPA: hypothetical protein [Siphoviridae sp. ctDmR33]